MENTYISFKTVSTNLDREVEITSLSFRPRSSRHNGERGLTGYPRRMVYNGREYNFAELGMQYLVKKGQEFISLFDMRDESGATYRPRNENNHWTLVSMKGVL